MQTPTQHCGDSADAQRWRVLPPASTLRSRLGALASPPRAPAPLPLPTKTQRAVKKRTHAHKLRATGWEVVRAARPRAGLIAGDKSRIVGRVARRRRRRRHLCTKRSKARETGECKSFRRKQVAGKLRWRLGGPLVRARAHGFGVRDNSRKGVFQFFPWAGLAETILCGAAGKKKSWMLARQLAASRPPREPPPRRVARALRGRGFFC